MEMMVLYCWRGAPAPKESVSSGTSAGSLRAADSGSRLPLRDLLRTSWTLHLASPAGPAGGRMAPWCASVRLVAAFLPSWDMSLEWLWVGSGSFLVARKCLLLAMLKLCARILSDKAGSGRHLPVAMVALRSGGIRGEVLFDSARHSAGHLDGHLRGFLLLVDGHFPPDRWLVGPSMGVSPRCMPSIGSAVGSHSGRKYTEHVNKIHANDIAN